LRAVGSYEDRGVVGLAEQIVIVPVVHLAIVSIDRVEDKDEFVPCGVVVVGRHAEDVPTLLAGDRD
jgi:hypothetical protein